MSFEFLRHFAPVCPENGRLKNGRKGELVKTVIEDKVEELVGKIFCKKSLRNSALFLL